jgi:hypothetical protein
MISAQASVRALDQAPDNSAINIKMVAIACAISVAVTIFIVIMFYYIAIDGNGQAPAPLIGPQYLMVTQLARQNVSAGTIFPWSSSSMNSNDETLILQLSSTNFQLEAGYTFKLTAALNYNINFQECAYSWYDSTNAKSLGVGGSVCCVVAPQNGTAVAYISTTTNTIVQLVIGWASNTTLTVEGLNADGYRVSWATIDVVQKNP